MIRQGQLEMKLAFRYLAGARGQGTFSLLTILAILGNVVGVMALVVGQAVMAGLETRATDQLVARTAHVWLTPAGTPETSDPDTPENPLCLSLGAADLAALGLSSACTQAPPSIPTVKIDEGLIRQIQDVEGVESARPVIAVGVFLDLNGRFDVRILRGVGLADLRAAGAQSVPDPQSFGLLIPSGLAQSGVLAVGQNVQLITARLQPTIVGALPLAQNFTIVGTYPAPSGAPLLTTLATAQWVLDMDGRADVVELYAQDPFDLRSLVVHLERLNDGDFMVQTWDQRSDSAAAFIGVLRMVLLVVLGLIILVSAFNIFAGQLMLTDAQRTAIAVMRTFGASSGTILRIFLIAGLFIGLGGAALGLGLGLLIATQFEVLTQIGIPGLSFFAGSPPQILLPDLVLACSLAIILAVIAAIFPARAAALTPPVEAFRYG